MPCHFDAEAGGYRINGDFFLPPVQLTLAEAMALSVLGGQVARGGQVPLLGDAWRAVEKVRSQLPAGIREELAGTDEHIRVQAARVSPQDGCHETFETLRRSIAKRRKVRCVYNRVDGKSTGDRGKAFLFRPYSLFFNQRAWYVIGHSERRGGERSLKLNRIRSLAPTDRPYAIPLGWTLEKSLGRAWRMIRGERRHIVQIRFDGEFGRNVADTLWHPTQTIEWQPDGSCLFRCEVDGLDEIVWWVLAYGPHAQVLTPAELRDRILSMAKAMCAFYEKPKGSPVARRKSR